MTDIQNQKTLLEAAMKSSSVRDTTFFELLLCDANPLTSQDLERNIQRRPELWKRYEGYLPYLRGREAPLGWTQGASLARDRDFLNGV